MWLTIYYEIISIFLTFLFGWNMLTMKDKGKQISCAVVLVPFLLRILFIH